MVPGGAAHAGTRLGARDLVRSVLSLAVRRRHRIDVDVSADRAAGRGSGGLSAIAAAAGGAAGALAVAGPRQCQRTVATDAPGRSGAPGGPRAPARRRLDRE